MRRSLGSSAEKMGTPSGVVTPALVLAPLSSGDTPFDSGSLVSLSLLPVGSTLGIALAKVEKTAMYVSTHRT